MSAAAKSCNCKTLTEPTAQELSDSVASTSKSTARSCKAVVINNYDTAGIISVFFRHRYGNSSDYQQDVTYPSLSYGQVSPPLTCSYWTGFGTSYDYWFISFTDSKGQVHSVKNNFYCSLKETDENTTVTCTLQANNEWVITMTSGGCQVTIN